MHAASLAHCDVIKTMMECNQSGAVVIDLKARDDNGNDAMDHARNGNGEHLSKQKQREFPVNSRKVQRMLEAHRINEDAGQGPRHGDDLEGAIEMKDFKNSAVHRKQTKEKSNKNYINNLQRNESNDSSGADLSVVPPEIRDSCIRRWADDLKGQCDESGRMSSLMSSSTASVSRSGSRQEMNRGNSAKQRPPSSLSASKKYLDKPGGSGEEEDDDFSLESLSDLVGTVRQYAQEIREIYAPIQKDEEERTKIRKEKKTRRISKNLQKTFIAKAGNAPSIGQPPVQEVYVEIHTPEGPPTKAERQPYQNLAQSRSHDPSSTTPMASLHVENEQLSSTWPRGRQRARSEDRNGSLKKGNKGDRSGIHGSNMSVISAPGPSTSFSRPQIPPDWNEKVSLEHEREVLSNAFKRFNKAHNDPLLQSINENKKNMKLRQHLNSSRQSVIQMGRNHQTPASNSNEQVPIISIIPPPSDLMTSSHLTRHERFHNETEMMSGRVIPENEIVNIDAVVDKTRRESKDGGHGVKSSAKGLRRRKSVEQGLGQPTVIDKY